MKLMGREEEHWSIPYGVLRVLLPNNRDNLFVRTWPPLC